MSAPSPDRATLFQQWAELSRMLAPAQMRCALTFDWTAAQPFIAAAQDKLAFDANKLRDLLEASRARLKPLEEPFDLDLGVHRWLAGEREEAYSDWLEWAVRQIREPSQVLRLFGISLPAEAGKLTTDSFEVQREVAVSYGHADRTGRLDLVIRYGRTLLVVIEVKKTGADEADTMKHEGYARWVREQNYPKTISILLATDAVSAEYGTFQFSSWAKVCVELRRLAPLLAREWRVTVAALMLAFVGAVEQNLLGFSAGMVRNVSAGRMSLFNSKIVSHLSECLGLEE